MKNKEHYSKEYQIFKRKKHTKSIVIKVVQFSILVVFISLWEILAQVGVIDTFTLSSPSKMWAKFVELIGSGTLFMHMGITLYEAIIGFLIATLLGTFVAIILWWNETLFKILGDI